ncbi:MAG: phosphodiester glycosidase family protein [Candidatus Sumerlaeia bacterium]|nr:phosphodiester glycosidase family protein [Candidatus Sumerlaeia bacterium]
MNHNLIDHTIMSRFLGRRVSKRDFTLYEDHQKDLAPGVTWRRRRFRFHVIAEDGTESPEALCINEVFLDCNSEAELRPALAAQFPHLVELPEIQNAYWATTFASGAIRGEDRTRGTRMFLNTGALFTAGEPERRLALRDQILAVDPNEVPDDEEWEKLEVFDPAYVEEEGGGYAVSRYLPAFPASRLVQASGNILAATNAGYFLNFPEEYDDGISALHQPVGGHMTEGRLVMPPWIDRPGLLHFKTGKTIPAIYGLADMVFHVEGLPSVPLRKGKENPKANPHGMAWRRFDGEIPQPPEGTAQIRFSADLVLSIEPHDGDRSIPHGGGLVWVTGHHAKALLARRDNTGVCCVSLREFKEGEPDWMVSSGPFLVRESTAMLGEKMFAPVNCGEFHPGGPPPTRFPYDTDKTAAPRTAVGTTASGGHKIVVVDGRRPGEHSCGLTLDGMAQLMKAVGCDFAMNLDGGGSSVMAIEGATFEDMINDDGPIYIVNVPSDGDGQERIVPLFLMVGPKR